MKLDLSKLQKIHCDDKCTILKHPSGHQLKIAHKGLSEEHRKELDELPMAMAEGGPLPTLPGYKKDKQGKVIPEKGSGPSKSSNTMPGSQKMAEDSYTEPQDQGTDVVLAALNRKAPPMGPSSPEYHSPPCINPSCKSYGRPHPNCRCYGGKLSVGRGGMTAQANYAEGGQVKSFCDMKQPHQKGCAYYAGGTGEVKKEDEAVPTTTPPPDTSQDPTLPAASPAPTPGSSIPSPDSTEPVPSQQQTPDSAASSEDQDQETSPDSVNVDFQDPSYVNGKGSPQQDGSDESQYENVDPNSVAIQTSNTLHNEMNNIKAQMGDGTINPKTYSDLMADKGFFGKMGSLFAMMIGGAGAGLAHQTPALMQMMDNQIQRDLDAQQKTQENKRNLWTLGNQTLHNLAVSTGLNLTNEMTQKTWSQSLAARLALHKQAQVVNNMKDTLPNGQPNIDKQKAQMALTMLEQHLDAKDSDAFTKIAIANATAGNAINPQGGMNTQFMKSGLMGPEFSKMGEDIEQKNLNGIVSGQANRPITESDKKYFDNKQEYDKAAQQYIDFANQHKNNWANLKPEDRTSVYNQSRAMTSDLYAKFLASKPYATAAEQNSLKHDNLISPAASWNAAFKGIPAVQQTMKDSQIEANTLAKSYGVKYIPGNRQSNKSTQVKPQQQIIRHENGSDYKKVNGGWQKVK